MTTVGKWGQKEPGGASQGTGWASDQPIYEWLGGYTRETAPENEALKDELFGADKRVGTGINFKNYSSLKISVQNGPANTPPLKTVSVLSDFFFWLCFVSSRCFHFIADSYVF